MEDTLSAYVIDSFCDPKVQHTFIFVYLESSMHLLSITVRYVDCVHHFDPEILAEKKSDNFFDDLFKKMKKS